VLTNPGQDIDIHVDVDGDGDLDAINLTADILGYPESIRKYNAAEFFFERAFDGKWFMQGSWTISHSYGNNEGYVRSDNGQTDAGLTTNFDQPGLLDGGYGDLPNDKRHKLKVFGSYKFADEWTAGGNVRVESGRPINCFGYHPTDAFAAAYDNESFFCDRTDDGVANTQLFTRGSLGRTAWTKNLDLSMEYRPAALEGKFGVKAEMFNVFDSQDETEVVETGEDDAGNIESSFLLPSSFQPARAVRFSLSYDF
jgi:hypothetical protein